MQLASSGYGCAVVHDPIGTYNRLAEVYRLYVESTFPFRYRALDIERRAALGRPGVLSQEPLIEPLPLYPLSDYTLTEAAQRLGSEYQDLSNIAAALLPSTSRLYCHQWESLRASVMEKKDLVVTTGTGSGKTECFLLPLLAEIARESTGWQPCGIADDRYWWRGGGARVPQWAHSDRQHAMRALILYPLNALVEDQLKRLRMTLDSSAAHRWLDENRGQNRVLFGRYTGHTPVPGSSGDEQAVRRLRESLRQSDASWQRVASALQQEGTDQETQYYFSRMDGGEMWSRWDMQETPPDILITNYSMLNIMLMRDVEDAIFAATREWLHTSPSSVFYLVVDELHSYRGTPGTEVAYILRLFLDRIGLSPASDQLRIVSTSASIDEGPRSEEFLGEFFGRSDRFKLISGEQVRPAADSRFLLRTHAGRFAAFAEAIQSDPLEGMSPPNFDGEVKQNAIRDLVGELGGHTSGCEDTSKLLGRALQSISAVDAIRDACCEPGQEIRATRASTLDTTLFGSKDSDDRAGRSAALRGFLLAMGLARREDGSPLQTIRNNVFFHNLENLWICSNPRCSDASCNHQEREGSGPHPPFGALHAHHRLTCSCGGRVLDLVICSSCGEVFVGGFGKTVTLSQQQVMVLTPDQHNLERLPDSSASSRSHAEYSVFWPSAEEPARSQYQSAGASHRWVPAVLDVYTGILQDSAVPPDGPKVRGWRYCVNDSEVNAMPPICPRCDTDYRRTSARSPLRQHRTGFQKSVQVLASALAREMPELVNNRRSRKLVVFSDSRQDAAKLAAGMELDHFRDMVRICLMGAHHATVESYAEVLQMLCAGASGFVVTIGAINQQLADHIRSRNGKPADQGAIEHWNNSQAAMVLNLMQAATMGMSLSNENLDLIRGFPTRVPLRHVRSIVWDRLLSLGICPGGTRADALYFHDDKQRKEWWDCFDWSIAPVRPKPMLSPAESQHLVGMQNSLMRELVLCLFPNATRTFESLGLGFVTYRYAVDQPAVLVEACQAIIRSLCERKSFRYWQSFFPDPQGQSRHLPKRVLRYIGDVGLEPREVQDALQDSGVWLNGEHSLGVDSDSLWVEMPVNKPSVARADGGWTCPKCGAFYMHPAGGRCVDCNVQLSTGTPHRSLDYYIYLADKAGQGFRFRSEELTGQTDSVDRPNRQRWFQEVFLSNTREIPAIHGIDLLSVTTTMEAGVDIGSLLSVMMANMPPRRSNYQQRVGRAGRRGTAVTVAVTFCRGRSHDEYYYQRPESITGDPPPTPYIDSRQQEILRRVLAKEILRKAFRSVSQATRASLSPESVHGEFGPVDMWSASRPYIERHLTSDAAKADTEHIVELLTAGTVWHTDSKYEGLLKEMHHYVGHDLLSSIDAVVADDRLTQAALSERLASAGILPMFGFPTRNRALFTDVPIKGRPWPPERGIVDRDLDIAISQFAPGSETVKDKRVYTSAGVADFVPAGEQLRVRPGFIPPLHDDQGVPLGNTRIGVCKSCQAVLYLDRVPAPHPGQTVVEPQQCTICHDESMYAIDAREPKSFFCCQNKDFDGTFEWVPRATRPMLCVGSDKQTPIEQTNLSMYSSSTDVISINDNGGVGGFDFHPVLLQRVQGNGAYAVDHHFWNRLTTPSYRVALLSRKHTDVLIVDIEKWPIGVYADPRTVSGRAAWYSFSFLLRIAAATLLDIDLQEIQAGIRTLELEGIPHGQAFLSDSLENGAGYCRWLAKEQHPRQILDSICDLEAGQIAAKWVAEEHIGQCDTSCNRCLRDFYNMQYHGLLDWRLALDMARIAQDQTTECDLAGPPVGSYGSIWSPLTDGENAPVRKTLTQLGYRLIEQDGLPVFISHDRNRALITCHPLWTEDNPHYQNTAARIREMYPSLSIAALNLFIAMRRPAEYL